MEKSGIQDKHPGSTTLMKVMKVLVKATLVWYIVYGVLDQEADSYVFGPPGSGSVIFCTDPAPIWILPSTSKKRLMKMYLQKVRSKKYLNKKKISCHLESH
jgi:hypothetical protein